MQHYKAIMRVLLVVLFGLPLGTVWYHVFNPVSEEFAVAVTVTTIAAMILLISAFAEGGK